MVHLRLLGTTSVSAPARRGGNVLEGPKRLALLAYLAAAQPFGVRRREALLEMLWANADRSRARGTLRSISAFFGGCSVHASSSAGAMARLLSIPTCWRATSGRSNPH